jgi:hypothetical protein
MDPLEIITEGCWLAVRFGMRVSPVPTGNLRVEGGVYGLGRGKSYHPLETVLVDVAASEDGFLDGFAQQPESSTDAEYIQGFLCSEQLRTARYKKDLPDRR